MAVLAVAAAGAGIGSAIGGSFLGISAAAWGWSIGSVVGNLLFAPPAPDVEGPRLGDLTVQTSTEGSGIARIWGAFRLAGNVIWSTDLIETRHEDEVGGKGGGGATQISYTYSVSCAVALCEGQIGGVRRIWADGKLIYDASTTSAATMFAGNRRAESIRIYTGSETQLADVLIQADQGAANTPAYRGIAYVVFESLQLADFANRIPNFTVEVLSSTAMQASYSHSSAWHTLVRSYSTAGDVTAIPYIAGLHTTGRIKPNGAVEFWDIWHDPTARSFRLTISSDYLGQIQVDEFIGDIFALESYTGYNSTPVQVGINAALITRRAIIAEYYALPTLRGLLLLDWDNGIVKEVLPRFTTSDLVLRSQVIAYGHVYAQCGAAGVHYMADGGEAMSLLKASATGLVWADAYYWYLYTGTQIETMEHGSATVVSTRTGVRAVDDVAGFARIQGGFLIQDHDAGVLEWWPDGGASVNLITIPGLHDDWFQSFYNDGVWVCPEFSAGTSPQYTVRARYVTVGNSANAGVPLSQIATDVLQLSGLDAAYFDVSALIDTTVRGYAMARPMAGRMALEPLQSFFAFDMLETTGKLKAVKRGLPAIATLAADDIVPGDSDDRIVVTRQQEVELPAEVSLAFIDADRDHQPGLARARRLTGASRQVAQLDYPIVASSQEAARVADVLLRDAWRSRARYQFRLPPKWSHLDPADVIGVPVAGQSHVVRLTRLAVQPGGALSCEAVSEAQLAYTSTASGTDSLFAAQSIRFAGATHGVLMDVPAVRDQDDDAGIYLAAAGYLAGWRGALLYKSADGGATWSQADSLLAAATIGSATAVLAAGRTDIFDEANRITVRLSSFGSALASASELAVLNGANAAALGVHGRWEILQYKTATDNGDGTWTLSGLLRGRRGTEWAVGLHAVGDTFVVLSTASLRRLAVQSAEIGAERHYRIVTLGQAIEAITPQPLTYAAVSLEPYAPVLLGGGRDAAGNITLTWVRRNRVFAEWRDYADVPMSEASESYEVEIWTAGFGALKRTITGLSAQTTPYTSAQQVTDFGSNQATVSVRVYQLSATAGRGYALQGTV